MKNTAWAICSTVKGYEGILEDAKTGQLAIYASRNKARMVSKLMDDVTVKPVKVATINPKRK